ncbi:cell division protein CrgA [Humibacter sp. BT305]|uniref:Cell division protein CrgA n=1 Tax=Cnuibacter physcomitrellae TaxID=1619308 RepID=A0A1X9LHR0_9MICO|nr:cell division protein CrgA [Cnuibacter physcomitrellae]ARJ03808.1 septation inhibitor protein [Cnuibacter physcomitrellae]AXH34427.1 cell division protein CrgA [Humibacter sp. BT305]MCS5497503.1 cell division protein CrgA [Cnuibacter physcomitrellae]
MARDRASSSDVARRSRDVQRTTSDETAKSPNPVWYKPVMFGFMLIGLLWIIVFYVSQGILPVPGLGTWNILIGFGIAFIGFIMTTRWR